MSTPLSPPLEAGTVDEMYAGAYRELRQIAHARLRGGGRNVLLDTTALVNESYLRLAQSGLQAFPDRARFLVYAGRAMRSVIIDLVRRGQAERHGGGVSHLTLTGDAIEAARMPGNDEYILRVHEALDALAAVDERMAAVVEMRYFAGLTEAEIGEALGVTDRTVRRDWEQARLFLAEALR